MGLVLVLLVAGQMAAGFLASASRPWLDDVHVVAGFVILGLMAAALAGAWKYRARFGPIGFAMTVVAFLLTIAGASSGTLLRESLGAMACFVHRGLAVAILAAGLVNCLIVAAQVRKAQKEGKI
jgi:hypothetical protein